MQTSTFSLWAMVLATLASPALAGTVRTSTFRSVHDDYRQTPKLEEFADVDSQTSDLPERVAREFLSEHAESYGVTVQDLSNLTLAKVQESLLGTHFHFVQATNGITVEHGEIIVSVSQATHAVYSAYNNYFPGSRELPRFAKGALITVDKAYDAAWADLRVHGQLQDSPKIQLVYRVNAAGNFKLVYLTYLNTAAPFGAWQHEVDAYTGEVLSRVDTAIARKKAALKVIPELYEGPVLDRVVEFADYERRAAAKIRTTANTLVNGKGLVFDPDPRTSLNDLTLQDDSPAGAFEAAYFERDLLDLAFDGSSYRLEGPWVKIDDFERPSTAPSTSVDGRWLAKRGDNAFDDAMTYFHLDQNQRYIQALGFTGAKAIQAGPVEVDTDGVNGDDNSHYIPSSNRLAFGHGCVDDDEDSDVILHEYGHAINFSINSSWNGGDTGAMGEGFGDYWAASYSYSTPNGPLFQPFNVYSWDGHGPNDACWPGRVLDATDAMYDPSRTYGAHQSLGNRQTDELWSTPLFQALTTLMAAGVPRSEVDQIILEAQFGLGSGIKMRELGQSTIAAARRLHPQGPHAKVFLDKFAAQKIVDIPQAILALDHVAYEGLGGNGVADPGEDIVLKIVLSNQGTLTAQNIEATLVAETPDVTVENGSLTFEDSAGGAITPSNESPVVHISNEAACGTAVRLTLKVTYTGGLEASRSLPLEFRLGSPQGMFVSATPNAAIPDNQAAGYISPLLVNADGIVTANLAVDVNLSHTYIGDLKVTLTSPSGTTVVLHNRTGGGNDNIAGRYPTTLPPAQPLSRFLGEPLVGAWNLAVVDSATSDTGTLVSWGLYDVAGYQCER